VTEIHSATIEGSAEYQALNLAFAHRIIGLAKLRSKAVYQGAGMVRALIVTLLTPGIGLALQAATAFEVATIQPSTASGLPIGIRRTRSRFTTSNTSLAFLIRWAYDLDERRQVGTTSNLESVRYDVVAKMPSGEPAPGKCNS
jgi:hypothetical protein